MSWLRRELGHTFRRRTVLSATDLSVATGDIPRLLSGGAGATVSKIGNRYLIGADEDLVSRRPLLRNFAVLGETYDYLTCGLFRHQDFPTPHPAVPDNPLAAVIYVAKPRLLQRTPFDGVTINGITYTYGGGVGTRIATRGATTWLEGIAQPYFQGDIITARRGSTGYTAPGGTYGNQYSDPLDPKDAYDNPAVEYIIWADINEGGRHWHKLGYTGDIDFLVHVVCNLDGSISEYVITLTFLEGLLIKVV
jgi:hypothetical protein